MKVFALSKEFFLCGWNIFDLCIVTASILDLIFELVDGLSVLRGLRLVNPLLHFIKEKHFRIILHFHFFFHFFFSIFSHFISNLSHTVKSPKARTIVDNNASSP
jgi:hypothetical protein